MQFFRETKINFMGQWKICLIISAILMGAGIISLVVKGGPAYNIDFMGGTLVQVRYAKDVSISNVRVKMKSIGFGDAIIQQFGDKKDILIRVSAQKEAGTEEESVSDFIIRSLKSDKELQEAKQGKIDINNISLIKLETQLPSIISTGTTDADNSKLTKIAKDIVEKRKSLGGIFNDTSQISSIKSISKEDFNKLSSKIFLGNFVVDRVEMVGPKVGKDLRGKAFFAIIFAIIGILAYVAIRYKFFFGIGGIVALAHDCFMIVGVFSLLNKEISLEVIAAILTVAGYSINDTIVIYDRVKENLIKSKSRINIIDFDTQTFFDVFNLSINQTFSRTILTSATVLLTVIALFFFGGPVIHDFIFALLIGFISGIYSTVYVASAIVYGVNYFWRKRKGLIEKKVDSSSKPKKLVEKRETQITIQDLPEDTISLEKQITAETTSPTPEEMNTLQKRKTRGKSRAKDRDKAKSKKKK